MKVRREILTVIAGVIWAIAGFNVVVVGIRGFMDMLPIETRTTALIAIGAIIVFIGFHIMFTKIATKNVARIRALPGMYHNPFKFMNARGYLIMAIMMGGGFGFRFAGLVPNWFLAFFYTGLGVALALAGVTMLLEFRKGNRVQ